MFRENGCETEIDVFRGAQELKGAACTGSDATKAARPRKSSGQVASSERAVAGTRRTERSERRS